MRRMVRESIRVGRGCRSAIAPAATLFCRRVIVAIGCLHGVLRKAKAVELTNCRLCARTGRVRNIRLPVVSKFTQATKFASIPPMVVAGAYHDSYICYGMARLDYGPSGRVGGSTCLILVWHCSRILGGGKSLLPASG